MFKKIRDLILKTVNKIVVYKRISDERKLVEGFTKKLSIYEGTDEEYQEVLNFWKQYGEEPEKYWFQFFGKGKNKFDKFDIPADIYLEKIIPYFCPAEFRDVLGNKVYIDYLMTNVKKPIIYVKYINKVFYDENKKILSRSEAYANLKKLGKAVFKTTDENGGRNVKVVDFQNNFDECIDFIENKMRGRDFIIQSLVKQSSQMAKFNETSVNTLRIISMIINDEVCIGSMQIRYGSKGSFVDNTHSGGTERGIDEQGYLVEYEIRNSEYYEYDIEGNKLVKEKVIGLDKAIKLIKDNHSCFPNARVLGWDICIGEDYEPIVIEVNPFPGLSQRCSSAQFGKYTKEMLDEYYSNNKN